MAREKIDDGLTKHQRWYRKNKERANAYSKEYHLKNREAILSRKRVTDKIRRLKKKHKPTVYLLVKENYVGTTEELEYRLSKHKQKGKDVSEVRVLGEFDSRADALEVEALIHDLGYKGKHRFNTYK